MRDVNVLDPLKIQDLLFWKLAELAAEPRFQGEIARAEREFFGANPAVRLDADVVRGTNAARFSEWYLLERDSELLGDVPARLLSWPAALEDILLESRVGVYMVQRVAQDELLVQDLDDGTQLEVAPIQGANVQADICAGDLLVGRLYPDALDRYVASGAMAVQHQAAGLVVAFQHDLRGLGIDRHLTQVEIEHLMFRGRAGPEVCVSQTPVERLEAELETLFERTSLSDWSVTAVSHALRDAEQPGIVADPILERVAFDSNGDIAQVQRLLLELWGAHRGKPNGARPQPPATPAPRRTLAQTHEPLGESLARRIEEGLAKNEDIEEMFAEVGELVGEDLSEPEVPREGDAPAAGCGGVEGFEGDLPALADEYCWDTKNESGYDRTILDRLVEMQREVPVPQLVLDGVQSQDLCRLLLEIYLEAAPEERADRVAAAFAALERFYRWCRETQQMELEPVIRGCQREMVEPVPRLQAVGLALSAAENPAENTTQSDTRLRPMASRVANVDGARIQLAVDTEPDLIPLDGVDAVTKNLREGDILLGCLRRQANGSGTFVGTVVALPRVAAGLIG